MLGCMVVKGEQITLPNFFTYDQHEYVIRSLLKVHGLGSEHQKRLLVKTGATQLVRCKRHDLTTFRRILAARVPQQSSQPDKTFSVVFPCNVARAGLGRFFVLGVRLEYRTWAYVAKHFDRKTWANEVLTLSLRPEGFAVPEPF
jgi:hypothetical protein